MCFRLHRSQVVQLLTLVNRRHVLTWSIFSYGTGGPIIRLIDRFKITFDFKISQIILQVNDPPVSVAELPHQCATFLQFIFLFLQSLILFRWNNILKSLNLFGWLTFEIIIADEKLVELASVVCHLTSQIIGHFFGVWAIIFEVFIFLPIVHFVRFFAYLWFRLSG